jgi:tetratricopeptide (TPR) repeat protein
MTYYELLGIGTGATSEEIHDAYSDLARVVHPCQAKALGLAGKEGGMLLLLEKATEAYLTLNDRDRSRKYLQDVGSPGDIHGGQQTADVRREEVQEMAEENYQRARAMVAREDYHFAVELLQQAVRVDPQAKYYVLLARCQARNPNWMQKAIATYGRAMQLSGQDLQIRLELAQLLETSGDLDRARREYDAILKRQPSHSQASQALERLRTKPRAPSADGGWLDKLRSRLPSGKK